jgi:hypothetical protein
MEKMRSVMYSDRRGRRRFGGRLAEMRDKVRIVSLPDKIYLATLGGISGRNGIDGHPSHAKYPLFLTKGLGVNTVYLWAPYDGSRFSLTSFYGVSSCQDGSGREKWANVPFKPPAGSLNERASCNTSIQYPDVR